MKNNLFFILIYFIPNLVFSQQMPEYQIYKDASGIVQSVEFPPNSVPPPSAKAFFEEFLPKQPNDEFRKIPDKSREKESEHERYGQYYNGVKVEGAGYNFHFIQGEMHFANGHYVKIKDLNTIPEISAGDAAKIFSRYLAIPFDSVRSYHAELLIKEVVKGRSDTLLAPALAYRVSLESGHPNNHQIG